MADPATTSSYDNDHPNNDRRDDIVEHREEFPQRAEEELRVSEKRFRTVIEQSPLSIHLFAPDGRSLLANSSWNELWNLEEGEEPEGTSIFEDEQIRATGLLPYIEAGMAGNTVTPPPLLYDPAHTGREGQPRWLQPFVYPVRDEEGRVTEVTLILQDMTERKALEKLLSHQAFHDSLTCLPNRALFMDRLGHALARARRREGKVAVLFLDLDNFKYVNDSLGHRAGDRLLREVADRLRAALRPEDTVARLGGDEFTILIENVEDVAEVITVAERISQGLASPFVLDGHEVFVATTTGIVLGGPGEDGGSSAEDLLRNADVAMYRGKAGGKDRHEVFDQSMSGYPFERLGLEGDLRRAVERGEFMVHYQPKVDLRTGRIAGAEALVRWRHPERGLVAPSEFMPLAEETGLIVSIGQMVLEEACRQARTLWEEDSGEAPLMMYVNLSARQFRAPGSSRRSRGCSRRPGWSPTL